MDRAVDLSRRKRGDVDEKPAKVSIQPTPASVDTGFVINVPERSTVMVSAAGSRSSIPGRGLGVIAPLANQIAFWLLFAHHFEGEVGSQKRFAGGSAAESSKRRSGSRTSPAEFAAATAKTGPRRSSRGNLVQEP